MKTVTQLSIYIFVVFICLFCTSKKPEGKSQVTEESASLIGKLSYKLVEQWSTDAILKTPESVIYDNEREIFYVSNVNQNPWEKDHNGFISRMSKTGEILDLEWITGFNGPKGMAIVNDTLFVADLDELVLIDIDDGSIIEKKLIAGASGLNDICNGSDGDIYFSDSNEGKIFHYANGEVSIFNADAPGRPNGLLKSEGKLFTAFSGASEFVSFDLNTLDKTLISNGIGHGDGITPTNDEGTYLVSDWEGEIFIISTRGFKQSLLKTKDQEKNTADIWFLPDENLVLVPTFFDNRVVAYRLEKE